MPNENTLAALTARFDADLQRRVTQIEIWQSRHEAVCALRWGVLRWIAIGGFVVTWALMIGVRTPGGEALLKGLGLL